MELPDLVNIKINIYTLACREMLTRLPVLQRATQNDLQKDYSTCLQSFNNSILWLLKESSALSIEQASEQLGLSILAEASVHIGSNIQVAEIYKEIRCSIQDKATSWSYIADLELFHNQGREIARQFFSPSPYQTTIDKLNQSCKLMVELDTKQEHALVAYRKIFQDENDEEELTNILLMRFSGQHCFTHYLAYPFLFLHEYSAHVYANDYENELFNDGWMIYAAEAFLRRGWLQSKWKNIYRDQVNVFNDYFYRSLNPNPTRGFRFARDLDAWLSYEFPGKFEQITFELAAFEPHTGEKPSWPSRFINELENEFQNNRGSKKFYDMFKNCENIREIMSLLQ